MVKYKIPELFLAFTSKDYEKVKCILESGIDLECTWNTWTPLRFALRNRYRDVVALLVKHGVDVNRRSTDYMHMLEPPLAAACRMNDIGLVNELLKSSTMKIDQVDFLGRGGLYFAASNFNAELVKILLNNGAHVRVSTDNANDPLFICTSGKRAVHQKAKTVARILLVSGCKASSSTLRWAVAIKDQDLFRLVIRSGYQMQNEEFLNEAILCESWPNDDDFCCWVMRSKCCPCTLKILCCSAIRDALIRKWKSVQECHAKLLPLPSSLVDDVSLRT